MKNKPFLISNEEKKIEPMIRQDYFFIRFTEIHFE